MKVIIEAEKADLDKLINEYKQTHTDNFSPDECKNYVRNKIINAVSINEADVRFFFNEDNYVTW